MTDLIRTCSSACIVLLMVWGSGCAASHPPVSAPPEHLVLTVGGEDTRTELNFDAHPAMTVPFNLAPDELCYIVAGDGLIVCGQRASYLIFGPDDGVLLVKDTPIYRLQPPKLDPQEQTIVQMYATIFMIAGSMERIPDALTEYLDGGRPHRRQAISLARKLLSDGGGEFNAAGRGGTFSVHIHLSDTGRLKLTDAIQAGDVDRSGILMTRFSAE